MTPEYKALLLEHAERAVALIRANAVHQSHLHELPSAAADKGLMSFCPGCELNVRTKRLYELASAVDDTQTQSRFGGRSRRDDTFERLTERKRIEEAP